MTRLSAVHSESVRRAAVSAVSLSEPVPPQKEQHMAEQSDRWKRLELTFNHCGRNLQSSPKILLTAVQFALNG